MVATTTSPVNKPAAQGALTYLWVAALAAYCAALLLAQERTALWINDLSWTAASAAAAFRCYRTAWLVDAARRRAWLLFGIGCTSWLVGQVLWESMQLSMRVALPFPGIAQFFFSAFAVFVTAGVLQLPESRERPPLTIKHLGNIGLVSCCLAVTVVLGMLEPALQVHMPALHLWIGLIHTLLVATTFLSALYALWTYHWGASWTPMLLIVAATGIYAIANLVYAHALLTGEYLQTSLLNASWIAMFGLLATAGREQVSLIAHPRAEPPQRMQARERWLEAVMPALLISIMVVVAVASSALLTPRVISWSAGLFILFAIILGVREAWIQSESQQLTGKLVHAFEQLQQTNLELRHSEARYRELATALEHRVSERTRELKRAYDELEGFSYAVAHDLKAPLRAINGFAHLFEAELEGKLSPRALEHLRRIRNGSLKMATLIDDLLAYSYVDRRGPHSSVVDLRVLIDSAVAQYADELQRQHITAHLDVEPLSVRVDAEGLLLAIRNLLENAIKYTRGRPQARISIEAHRGENGVLLTIADNGIGFDMEYHDHIFKIFQRLHRDEQYPGTGIGLALVRKAVERIGGRVWAQSEPGKGATFYVELPSALLV